MKRGNNEGTIFKRSNGKWSAQVSLQGRRLCCTFKTRRECQKWLKRIIGQIDDGMTFSGATLYLWEYMNDWITCIKTLIRQSSWIHYDQLNRSYISKGIGNIKLIDLKPEQVQRYYNHLLEEGVGIHSVLKIHAVFHKALEHAVLTGVIPRNPASYTQLPRKPHREMKCLSESDVSQLLISAKGHRLEALFHLAVISGARQMELLGLKWSDLDWIKKTLKFERQLVRPDGEGVKFAPPKTRYGRRVIALGTKTVEILRDHYECQEKERLSAGETWKEYGLIFPSIVGTPMHLHYLSRNFRIVLKDAGLPRIRFHDLRHYGKLNIMGSKWQLRAYFH